MHRRHAAGSGGFGLDAVAAALEAEIQRGGLPPGARAVFDDARRRLGASASKPGAQDAELERLIGRIQGLRAKTVEQGCTEQEALAAAAKVAELLDRYGLSLSELDLQRQACDGAAVETSRKRVGPVDDCVPAVAAFFDCRAWGEKAAAGTLRYVFFGLPADVAAARYLYDLVERAFDTKTALFRAGHRQLVELRLRWGAIGTACSWLRRSGDAGDLGPSLEGLAPGGSILGGRHLMAAKVEEVADPIVGGQEALRLAG